MAKLIYLKIFYSFLLGAISLSGPLAQTEPEGTLVQSTMATSANNKSSANKNGSGADYNRFLKSLRNANAYRDAAMANGVEVGEGELEKRIALYKRLYPKRHMLINWIRNQLMAEKYLEKSGEMKVPEKEIKERYAGMKSMKQGNLPEYEEIKQVLKSQILFNRKEFVEKAERFRDLRYLKHAGKNMMLKDVLIQGNPRECLVKLPSDTSCFITLAEFNAKLSLESIPEDIDIVRLRNSCLKNYIKEKFLANKARLETPAKNADSLLQRMQESQEFLEERKRIRTLGRPVYEAEKLVAVYQKFYQEEFAPVEHVTMQIIGSSDSGYIDSLYHLLKKVPESHAGKEKPIDKTVKAAWLDYNEKDLPAELVIPTDTFYTGQFSKPIKTPYGFFISKLKEIHSVSETPFDSARERCIYLATREKFLKMDSVISARSKAYYEENITEFLTPDTLRLRAWLVPLEVNKDSVKKNKAVLRKAPDDTLAFKALELSSLVLPPDVQKKLGSQIEKQAGKTFFGPITGKFGKWYLHLQEKKPGGLVIPFYKVKEEIVEKISSPEIPEDTITGQKEKSEVMLNLGLMRSYIHDQVVSIAEMNGNDRERMLNENEIELSDIDSGMQVDVQNEFITLKLQDYVMQKLIKEADKYVEIAEIRYDVINQ